MKKLSYSALAMILLIALLSTGCQFEDTTYKTMFTLNTGYNVAMESVNDLRKKGIMTPEQVDKALFIGNQYYDTFEIASEAFRSYIKVKSSEDKDKINAAIVEATRLLFRLEEYVRIFEMEEP